jgi:hypothetical protein
MVSPEGLEPSTYGLKVDQAASTRASLVDFIAVFASLVAPIHSGRRHFMSRFMSRECYERTRLHPQRLAFGVGSSSAAESIPRRTPNPQTAGFVGDRWTNSGAELRPPSVVYGS